jgi:pimeloyl-ACP methyl ester carboxylesterase
MSTTAAPSLGTPPSNSDVTPVPARVRSPRLIGVVAVSAIVGPLAAAALTLGVFAGAPEHVITGTALLGLAMGWATLAVGSAGLTTRPQRWAVVPAAGMGGVAIALLVLAPGDAALGAAGWVWPPALLALTTWTTYRAVRSLGFQAPFWVLSPALVLLVLASVGGGVETVRLALQGGTPPMPGDLYDVGGYRLHLNCTGTGTPTVVLLAGMGETSTAWGHVQPAVAGTTRVCSYDREGQGWSDDTPGTQDGVQLAADLHTLLDRAGERGPYVLAGHSVGGPYAMTYAAQYPDEVAGLVLLDSTSPDQFSALPDYPGAYAFIRRATALLPVLERLGAGPLLESGEAGMLPDPAAAQARAFASSTRDLRTERDEVAAYPTVFEQAKALTGLGSRPLVVVTATGGQRQAGWFAAQARLAELSGNSTHRFSTATHTGLLFDERDAAVSATAVTDVVRAVRTDTPVVER